MPNRSKTTATFNADWFTEQLEARDLSKRRLAKLMNLDPAAVSLMLRGLRGMSPDEAAQISGLLRVPVTEVLRNAGVPVSDDTRAVNLTHYLHADGSVVAVKAKTFRRIQAPADVPGDGFALQVRAAGSVADGWVLICEAAQRSPADKLDHLVVGFDGKGLRVGVLSRGYEPGTYNLASPVSPDANAVSLSLEWVSGVLWMRPV